jgi:hypothetical protein
MTTIPTTTTRKTATTLQHGDRIVTSHPGQPVYLDRICSVERFDAQRIRVRVEGYEGWIYYLVDDQVRVLAGPALAPAPRQRASGITR